MNNRDNVVLNKILREIDEIEEFIQGHTFETFNQNSLLKKALAMSIIYWRVLAVFRLWIRDFMLTIRKYRMIGYIILAIWL